MKITRLCQVILKKILKPSGIMIVSTFLREYREDDYWINEEKLWKEGKQDSRLLDFGDITFFRDNVEIFVHIPSYQEFSKLIEVAGFEIIGGYLWDELVNESDKDGIPSAGQCFYWALRG